MNTKQVIVMRTDLNMRKGKMCAQAAHASMAFLTRRLDVVANVYHGEPEVAYEGAVILSAVEVAWLNNSFTKICVGIDSEQGLLDLHTAAVVSGIEAHLVLDNGTTEFGGIPTYTCLALGPDDAERIDALTGTLKLL
jgi:PTH2 family peptidyl-tRNA hydrolase